MASSPGRWCGKEADPRPWLGRRPAEEQLTLPPGVEPGRSPPPSLHGACSGTPAGNFMGRGSHFKHPDGLTPEHRPHQPASPSFMAPHPSPPLRPLKATTPGHQCHPSKRWPPPAPPRSRLLRAAQAQGAPSPSAPAPSPELPGDSTDRLLLSQGRPLPSASPSSFLSALCPLCGAVPRLPLVLRLSAPSPPRQETQLPECLVPALSLPWHMSGMQLVLRIYHNQKGKTPRGRLEDKASG